MATKKSAKPKGQYLGFAKLEKKVAAGGASNPAAVAYSIGVRKYGKVAMAKKAAAGRKRASK